MREKIPYNVVGAEGYFEVCPSEYIGDVVSFRTYVGERGPSVFRYM
jgi:hypothetical protein